MSATLPAAGHGSRLIFKVTLLLAVFIYFQQVFVVNIGGSLKLYEVLALVTAFWFAVHPRKTIYGLPSLYLFFLFCVSSLLGYFYFYLLDEPIAYYSRFPEAAKELRFNRFLAPVLVYIYCLFTWTCINAITGSRWVFARSDRIYKRFVVAGAVIAVYALYGMVFVGGMGLPDLVPDMFDYRNSQPEDYPLRTIGFSSEPGQYAPILSWTFLYAYYAKGLFSRRMRLLLLAVTGVCLLFTFSSSLVVFLLSWSLFIIFFGNLKAKLQMLVAVAVGIVAVIALAEYFELSSLLEYFFVEKFREFLDPGSAVGQNSGVQRAFTSLLGWEVFKHFPLFGVGAGNSYFFLHAYESRVDLQVDMLTHSTAPQNAHSIVLAEMGVFGYALLLAFYVCLLWQAIKQYRRRRDVMLKAHIIGAMATFGFLFAIYPIYSLYLWFNIALLMNNLYFHKDGS